MWARLQPLLAPAPGRLEFAVRLAVICALAALLARYYDTPAPALTVYLAFFLNRPDRATSTLLSVGLTAIVTIVLGLVVLVAQAVVDNPPSRIASMAAISVGMLFLASASKLRPVGGVIALIVANALNELGGLPDGEFATRGILYAWLFVGIPAGASIAVNLLAAPSPRHLVQQSLARRLRGTARVLRDPERRADLIALRREGDAEIASRLKLAAAERTSPAADVAALRQATDASIALLAAVHHLASHPSALLPASLRESLAATLDDMADVLARGGYPVDVEWSMTPPAGIPPLARDACATVAGAVARFAEPPPPPSPPAASPTPKPSRFMQADAFTNPAHLRFALKTTAAAMACYIAFSLLDWPGIHTCMTTCYIVSLATVADTVGKLTLRLVGCLVGAGLGTAALVFVLPSFTSIQALLLIVAAGVFVSAWVAAGSPRIAYAGFQMAFAFLLCVLQDAGPAFDLTVARDRVVGILFGNAVAYLVSVHCWPVSVAGRIEAGLAEGLERLGQMLQAGESSLRRRLAAQVQATLGTVSADLDLACREPAAVRPAAGWLDRRRTVASCIDALETSLLLATEAGLQPGHDLQRRIERLAKGDPAELPSLAPQADVGAPHALVEERLRRLERAALAAKRHDEATHATA